MLGIVATNNRNKPLPAGNINIEPGQTVVIGEYTEEKSSFIKALKLSGLGVAIRNVEIEPAPVMEEVNEQQCEIQTTPDIVIPDEIIIEPVPEIEDALEIKDEIEITPEPEIEPPAPEKKKGGRPKKAASDVEMPVSE